MNLKKLIESYNLEISSYKDIDIRYTGRLDTDSPHLLSFLRIDKFEQYERDFLNSKARVIIVPKAIKVRVNLDSFRSLFLFTTNNEETINVFYDIHNRLNNQGCSIIRVSQPMIHHDTKIARSARIIGPVQIGEDVILMDGVYVGRNVIIGDRTIIKPNAVILDNVKIMSDCIIDSGVIIGGNGFRYINQCSENIKVNHYGGVIIGNKVEIGSNSCIDRATFSHDATVIEDNVKINNLVHIAHNVSIGKDSIVCAHVLISGSTKIGKKVYVAPFAAIKNNACVERSAKILIGSIVTTDLVEGEMVSGNFAMPHKQWKMGNIFIRGLNLEKDGEQ